MRAVLVHGQVEHADAGQRKLHAVRGVVPARVGCQEDLRALHSANRGLAPSDEPSELGPLGLA